MPLKLTESVGGPDVCGAQQPRYFLSILSVCCPDGAMAPWHNLQAMGRMAIAIFKYQELILKCLPSRPGYSLQSVSTIVRIPQANRHLPSTWQWTHLWPPFLPGNRMLCGGVFHITGTSLGFEAVSFSRSGPSTLRTLLYLGLPLSNPIVIERSFMCSTFQVAFLNHQRSRVQSTDTCSA